MADHRGDSPPPSHALPSARATHPALATVLALAALLLLWQLRGVLLLVFGGLLVAVALGALASSVSRRTGLTYRRSVAASVAALVVGIGLASWLIGASLAQQLSALGDQLPRAAEAAPRWVQDQPLGPRLLELVGASASEHLTPSRILSAAGVTAGASGEAVLMVLIGVFVAAEPQLYRSGLLALTPPSRRARVAAILQDAREALGRWLRGQGVSMLFVGVATGLGLFALGVPLALSLGVIAGGLGFIPFFGAIGSGLLAVLLAFSEGPRTAVHVTILCVVIQQIEGHVLMPLIQRWSVQLAPVLSLIAVVVFGKIFGLLGVLLAVPLMVLVVVLVRQLVVQRWADS